MLQIAVAFRRNERAEPFTLAARGGFEASRDSLHLLSADQSERESTSRRLNDRFATHAIIWICRALNPLSIVVFIVSSLLDFLELFSLTFFGVLT